MRTFFGMILGALLLICGVYVYDSMRTSSVANGEVAQDTRTIVNWDVAARDWNLLKTRTREQWDDYLGGTAYRLTAEDEAFIDALVVPGHPSTPGYNDPAYPLEGRPGWHVGA
jgi:hypothetical protein